MRRGDLLLASVTAVLARPSRARAQLAPQNGRVGLLTPIGLEGPATPRGGLLVRALETRGYVLGRNLTLVARAAEGRVDRLPALARDLAAEKVDAIVTVGFPAALAAKRTGVPTVVAVGAGDPVATGLVASLARPGGTVTGISDNDVDLSAKRLELLRDIRPGLRRFAILYNADDLGMSLRYRVTEATAGRLGLSVQALGVREPDDFATAFRGMDETRPEAILMVTDALTNLNRKRIFDDALARRIPAIYEQRSFVREGGLMAYGSDETEAFDRVAGMIDRIVNGEAPADLPFEQPTRFTFAINLKVATAIGLAVPPTLLARADEVVE
ncbi:ABC transporter substrate-binding protein [Methylobacterium nonmethylotrophicum]|nr:ABC transporter substrate-binding protein [Methylobacterium nonmethylotrophicum]